MVALAASNGARVGIQRRRSSRRSDARRRRAGTLICSCDRTRSALEVFAVVAELEGHPDNAGASVYGGLIAASADRVAQLTIVHDWVLLVWIPDSTTSTDKSRTQLDAVVPRVDAVANLAAIAHFVSGVSTGDESLVRAGVNDRLHQTQRLAGVPESANALTLMQKAGQSQHGYRVVGQRCLRVLPPR